MLHLSSNLSLAKKQVNYKICFDRHVLPNGTLRVLETEVEALEKIVITNKFFVNFLSVCDPVQVIIDSNEMFDLAIVEDLMSDQSLYHSS